MTKHVLLERSSPEDIVRAEEAADWLLDAVATATQDRRFLRGEPEYDPLLGGAIFSNGVIACLRFNTNKEKENG